MQPIGNLFVLFSQGAERAYFSPGIHCEAGNNAQICVTRGGNRKHEFKGTQHK